MTAKRHTSSIVLDLSREGDLVSVVAFLKSGAPVHDGAKAWVGCWSYPRKVENSTVWQTLPFRVYE